jgi:hypothetical protein
MTAPDDAPRLSSRDPRLGCAILLLALAPGAWFAWRIHRTIGLGAPHFWELLRDDPLFDLAMLDFFLTATWALIALAERSSRRGWRFWLPLAVFCAAPSVGIALFLLLDRPTPDPVR